MKVLENTPAVLSLGKLCDENGYSYEWINGQKPHLIKDGNRINLQHGELRSNRGSWLDKFFLDIFIILTNTYETGESLFFIFFILTFSTYSRRNVVFEKEKMHLTVISLQCQCLSWLMIERGNLWKPKPTKYLKQKETTMERRNPCDDSEIPEWLQELRENLVDDEIPLQGGSHASSSHEASLEPTTKRREDLGKHNVHTLFPKDRNCEICKRTKITRAPCRRRNGEAVPRAVNFGDLKQQTTRSKAILASLETIIDTQSPCRI